MIEEKLKNLSEYIDAIEGKKPLSFFCDQIKTIQQEIDVESQQYLHVKKKFDSELERIFSKYQNQKLPDTLIIMLLYDMLLSKVKTEAIYSYAFELGLDPYLYKDEMRLLFKGKK